MALRHLSRLAAALALFAATLPSTAAEISGAGSTFVNPILAKWASMYREAGGTEINYASIGSGGGIAQIKAKTVTFGATDMPLKPAELDAAGLIQFPVVIGGDVPVVNIPGIQPGQLTLDGATLADIYLGKVSHWNDPAIKKLNPNANLPATAITVVHRSDGSGTTFIWANYLAKVSPEWAKQVGFATSVDWPTGVGAKGNEGVAANVAQTPGSIGYVEYAYAKQNHLAYTRVVNREHQAVEPNIDSFQSAAVGADWAHAPGFYVLLTDAAGAKSWPITGSTFVLVYKKPVNPGETGEALKFFKWALEKGDAAAKSLDYVAIPEPVTKQIEASWHQVQGAGP